MSMLGNIAAASEMRLLLNKMKEWEEGKGSDSYEPLNDFSYDYTPPDNVV